MWQIRQARAVSSTSCIGAKMNVPDYGKAVTPRIPDLRKSPIVGILVLHEDAVKRLRVVNMQHLCLTKSEVSQRIDSFLVRKA